MTQDTAHILVHSDMHFSHAISFWNCGPTSVVSGLFLWSGDHTASQSPYLNPHTVELQWLEH